MERPQTGHARRGAPRSAGFSLLELVAVMALLVTLASFALPLFRSTGEAREERCTIECSRIGEALARYHRDTRLRPVGPEGRPEIGYLLGDAGRTPDLGGYGAGLTSEPLGTITRRNTWNNPRWRGPYVTHVGPDPWGRRYLVWTGTSGPGSRTWILSAGEDGVVQTAPDAATLAGDDVGVILE